MSYHTNKVARNLPRLGRRSVGGLGASLTPDQLIAYATTVASPPVASPNSVDTGLAVKAALRAAMTPDQLINAYAATYAGRLGANPAQVAYYRTCMGDLAATGGGAAVTASEYLCRQDQSRIPTLSTDGQSFYYQCLAQRAAGVPIRTQNTACYAQAQQIPGSGGVAPSSAPVYASMMPAPAAPGMSTTGWLLIGGGVAVLGVVGYLVLK